MIYGCVKAPRRCNAYTAFCCFPPQEGGKWDHLAVVHSKTAQLGAQQGGSQLLCLCESSIVSAVCHCSFDQIARVASSAMLYECGEHIITVLGVMACLNRPVDQVVCNHFEPHFGQPFLWPFAVIHCPVSVSPICFTLACTSKSFQPWFSFGFGALFVFVFCLCSAPFMMETLQKLHKLTCAFPA